MRRSKGCFWLFLEDSLALAIEEKYDQVRQLIAMGKERGYLLYDEVNDMLPAEVHSSEEIDDLLSTFEQYGIDMYEDQAAAKAARAAADPTEAEAPEVESKDESGRGGFSELDLTPGMLEKTNDPVRMYLREMGTVPLLTREGEVAIAKRIERGQNPGAQDASPARRSFSRNCSTIGEDSAQGHALDQGNRSVRRRRSDRRKDRKKDPADSEDHRPDRKLYNEALQAGRQARATCRSPRSAPYIARWRASWRGRASRCRSWCARSSFTASKRSA